MSEESKKRRGGPSGTAATVSTGEPRINFYGNYNSIVNISRAEILFDQIGTGKGRALHVSNRDTNNNVSRAFRQRVAEANKTGDCIINTGDGSGYYRPTKGDELEEAELDHYLRSELHRAQEIRDKVDAMRESHYGRY